MPISTFGGKIANEKRLSVLDAERLFWSNQEPSFDARLSVRFTIVLSNYPTKPNKPQMATPNLPPDQIRALPRRAIAQTFCKEMPVLQPMLCEAMPDFATELTSILNAGDHSAISVQVPTLRIVDRCDCGSNECATFYTSPRPIGSRGVGHRNVMLPADNYDLILDLVDEKIVCVEILDRPDLKSQLDQRFRPCQNNEEAEQVGDGDAEEAV